MASISAMTETGIAAGRRRKRRWLFALAVVAVLAAGAGWFWHKEGRAWLYGVEAYVYGFPLVMMDLTKEAATAERVLAQGIDARRQLQGAAGKEGAVSFPHAESSALASAG
jgi:hypothetical protein